MLTIEQLKKLIQEEIDTVLLEFRPPEGGFAIDDIDLSDPEQAEQPEQPETQEEPELKKAFTYTPNKEAAQAFLQKQLQQPQK